MFQKGEDVQEEQIEHQQERMTFIRVGLAQGQAMVRIHDVNAFDNSCSTATSKVVPCLRRPHCD